MSPETLFQVANIVVLTGWAALLASPFVPKFADRFASFAVPGLLSVAYAGLILAFWTRAEGGFGSLDDLALLFRTPEILLAGWLHYLAYDLFVGAWIVRRAREQGMPFAMVLPTLPLAFLFGPIGFLAFLILSGVRRDRTATVAA